MPKKKIKQDEIVTAAGNVLDAEQAAMVRKQTYEGSYSLRPPEIEVTDDDITVRVNATVYTVYGDSPLHTTYTPSVFRRSGSVYVRGPHANDVESTVRNAIERARDAAEAAIKSIDEEWEANVGPFDDEDEGLREGPVVGGSLGSAAEADDEAAEIVGDTIRIPNAEYADLLAAKRKGEFAIAQLESFPVVGRVFLKSGVVTLRTTSEGLASLDAAIATFPVDAFWRRSCGTASDVSDSAQDDGGPVEPELDIDALVAAVDVQRDTCSLDIRAVRSAEYPALTVTVTGAGSADLVRRILSEIHLPSLTEPLVVARPVDDDVGEFAATTVDFHVGGNVAKFTADQRAVDELRTTLASARNAGGLR